MYEDELLLYGDLINNSNSPQSLTLITGTFYDDQGQVIADAESTYDYWPPIETLPPGGRMPFELTVVGIQGTANFTLSVEAEPSSELPHQDFTFSDLSQWVEEDIYCVEGILHNQGGELQDYLVIVAVLYDAQNNVINFGDYFESHPESSQSSSFTVCAGPPNHDVVRYELRAWGQ